MLNKKIYIPDARVNDYKIHPNYETVPQYDIAILNTERIDEATFNPVCLTHDDTSLVGYQGSVLSFAPTSEDDTQMLYGAKFIVTRRMYCKKIVSNVPEHTFCVTHQGSNLCHGDSGAGFIMRYEVQSNKRYFLRGIVSTGLIDHNSNCIVEDFVIFTDVTKFMSFITEN